MKSRRTGNHPEWISLNGSQALIIILKSRAVCRCFQAGTGTQEEGWLGELLQSMERRRKRFTSSIGLGNLISGTPLHYPLYTRVIQAEAVCSPNERSHGAGKVMDKTYAKGFAQRSSDGAATTGKTSYSIGRPRPVRAEATARCAGLQWAQVAPVWRAEFRGSFGCWESTVEWYSRPS